MRGFAEAPQTRHTVPCPTQSLIRVAPVAPKMSRLLMPTRQVQCDLLGALSDVEGVGRAELSLSDQVRAEAASAAKLVALSAACALEHEVIQDWSESEARHGVNPYEVIGARCDDPNERIEELFKVKVAKYTAGTGVAKILLLRAERSYALISDETKRQQCDERMRDRVASKSWAILRYANGPLRRRCEPVHHAGRLAALQKW